VASDQCQRPLVTVLVALLVTAIWDRMAIWRATPSMPLYGNIIVGVAEVLALAAGCGLPVLMYHSQGLRRSRAHRQDATRVARSR
jgi:hypothetical protein